MYQSILSQDLQNKNYIYGRDPSFQQNLLQRITFKIKKNNSTSSLFSYSTKLPKKPVFSIFNKSG